MIEQRRLHINATAECVGLRVSLNHGRGGRSENVGRRDGKTLRDASLRADRKQAYRHQHLQDHLTAAIDDMAQVHVR